MGHDPVANLHFGRLYDDFLDYQSVLLDDNDSVIAVGNSIPLVWREPIEALPERGWDWALEKGVRDHEAGEQPNVQSALAIAVRQDCQGRGLSERMILGMKQIGAAHGMTMLIVPARPTRKADYPLTPIERYIEWRNEAGLPFDPWLRVHVRLGATIVKPALRSMTITGSVAQWEEWTGMQFPDAGDYIVPQALVPVAIDRTRDEGCYVEPNVWLRHAMT